MGPVVQEQNTEPLESYSFDSFSSQVSTYVGRSSPRAAQAEKLTPVLLETRRDGIPAVVGRGTANIPDGGRKKIVGVLWPGAANVYLAGPHRLGGPESVGRTAFQLPKAKKGPHWSNCLGQRPEIPIPTIRGHHQWRARWNRLDC